MNSNTTDINNIQDINAQNGQNAELTTIVSLSNNHNNNNNNNNPHHNLIIEETIKDDRRRLSTNSTDTNIIQDIPNNMNTECILTNNDHQQQFVNVINENNNNNYTKNIINNNNYDNLASEILDITKPALTTTTTTTKTSNNMPSKSESTTTTTTTTVQQNIMSQSQYQQRQTVENCVSIVSVNIIIGSLLIIGIVFLWYYMGWYYGVPAIFVAFIIILITSGGWHWLYIAIVTAPRDMRALRRYIQLLTIIKQYQSKNLSVNDVFLTYVTKHPEKTCLLFEDRPWTFRKVNEFSNRIANLFQQHGYKSGDVIALFMDNRPEFVCIWLGLSKIGVIVPLINTNLRQATLLHSISVANCKAVIFGESLRPGIDEIAKALPSTLHLYQYNDDTIINRTDGMSLIVHDLAQLMTPCSKENVMYNDKDKHHNKLLYIYTSGTTGMPKAAVITTSRYLFIASAIHILASFKRTDTFYTPLPLYHTAAGMMCVGQALVFGCTVVIRKKFSASNYFSDCIKYKCTVAQYIGEMCRYILATPKSTSDTGHNIRLIFGNGLRPQIWPEFIKRFNIPLVAEFYGATEGNASIVNVDNTVGAIGFISRIIPSVYPISIIRCDENTGEPIRGPNGLCQKCEPNEPGVFIGKIVPGNPSRAFLGYVDRAASEKKIIKNIFKKGDSAFLSGDIVVADTRGNLFFKDRTGDTYRWKGENVSTSEVEGQLNITAGYRDTIVYGVEIPNTDGRAGMAAILDIDHTLDLTKFANDLKTALPSYARPIFIRLLNSVDLTGTFKLKKIDLQLEGFNPNIIADRLYYLTSNGNYKLLDSNNYELICNGVIRF